MNYKSAVLYASMYWPGVDATRRDATGWGLGWLIHRDGQTVGFIGDNGVVREFNQLAGWGELELSMDEQYQQAAIRG